MSNYCVLLRCVLAYLLLAVTTSCALLLLNGHLSHGYYVSPQESFKCKLPGGVLSRQLKITDRSNDIGETVTFTLNAGLLWRVDHLRLGQHKLASLDNIADRREQLDKAKINYFKFHLQTSLDIAEVNWEQFKSVDNTEVLIVNTYLKWDSSEETRELLSSVDGDYLNVLHYAQNVSSNLKNITSGSLGLYKSCEF